MDLDDLASQLLATASAAAPTIGRTFVAGGPEFARTCTLLATYASLETLSAQAATGRDAFAFLAGCAAQPVPQATLVYAKDCYPMPSDDRPPKLPPAADLTAWSTDFLQTCQAIIDGIMTAVDAGTFGDCAAVTLGPVTWTGPRSGVCTMQLPLSVRAS